MHISLAQNIDADKAMSIFLACKAILDEQGIHQWTDDYPNKNGIISDIENGHLYKLEIAGELIGVINISKKQDQEYASVNWNHLTEKVLVVHRLAVDPNHQGKGYAQKLMTFAEEHAKAKGYEAIRLDTYSINEKNVRFYQKRDYTISGEIYFPKREHAFYCMEKTI